MEVTALGLFFLSEHPALVLLVGVFLKMTEKRKANLLQRASRVVQEIMDTLARSNSRVVSWIDYKT